ncbi:MAG: permease [Tsuneonella suprasediminis]|nr:permease [Altererythrobacter sp. N1]
MTAIAGAAEAAETAKVPGRLLGLYLLLGFSAGLPFYMFNAVLTLRLAKHGVDIAIIGFFAWVALLPTFKFLWAPLLEKWDAPGFSRFWGKRRGWIMLAQLGIFTAMIGMAATSDDTSLPLTALFAVTLAFWTTTLEIAADGWRIELAPSQSEQGPVVAANLWGYRSAMVAAGSGAALIAARADWTWAYLAIAAAAFAPFPILAAMRGEADARGGRWASLASGVVASGIVAALVTVATAAIGWVALRSVAAAGVDSDSNITPFVLVVCMLPFIALAFALPRIRKMGADAPWRRSPVAGPYVDIFWRYGYATLAVLAFVSLYRVGDVLALTLSHPLWNERGYSLDQFGNGLAGTVFVVYLSMLVNPRYPAAQYAFLSGFAFLLARLLAGASGTMQKAVGYDGFFLFAGFVTVVAVVLIPFVTRVAAREPDEEVITPESVFGA